MAKKKPTPLTAQDIVTLPGDYYGQHDGCLYRIGYAHGRLWQARCTCPAESPAADVFGEPYEVTAQQLRWLLAFGCFKPAIELITSTAKPKKVGQAALFPAAA